MYATKGVIAKDELLVGRRAGPQLTEQVRAIQHMRALLDAGIPHMGRPGLTQSEYGVLETAEMTLDRLGATLNRWQMAKIMEIHHAVLGSRTRGDE